MSLVLTGGGQQPVQTKPPLLSPGMLPDPASLQHLAMLQGQVFSDPLGQTASAAIPPILNIPPPVLLPGGLLGHPPIQIPPPNLQQQVQQHQQAQQQPQTAQQHLQLLQQLQLQGLQQ